MPSPAGFVYNGKRIIISPASHIRRHLHRRLWWADFKEMRAADDASLARWRRFTSCSFGGTIQPMLPIAAVSCIRRSRQS